MWAVHFRQSYRAVDVADPDVSANMYSASLDITASLGFQQYEVSNFAKVGHQSKHNLHYWEGGEYIGIGPGAASRLMQNGCRVAIKQVLNPSKWMQQTEANGRAPVDFDKLSSVEKIEEILLLGLRSVVGITRDKFRQHSGEEFEELFPESLPRLCAEGLLVCDAQGLRTTPRGLMVLDTILLQLISTLKERPIVPLTGLL